MKLVLSIFLMCLGFQIAIAQTEPLYRTATNVEPFQQGVDGTIMLKVLSSGATKAELDDNAKKIALYNAIFVGYPEANGIPKSEAMAKSMVYDQKKTEFDAFIMDPTTPAKYSMSVAIYPGAPISKVKRLLEGPVIVSFNIKTLRRDLEEKAYIPSITQLGYKPSVTIMPEESWLTRKRYYTDVEAQGITTRVWKYREAILDQDFKLIADNFKAKFEGFFDIKSVADVLDSRNTQDLINTQSTEGVVQSVESKLISAIGADLLIRIDLTNKMVGGKSQATVTLKCTDPYTNSDVINGSPVTKDSHEDMTRTTKAAFLGAVDDIYPRITDYFIARQANGLQGAVSVEIAGNLAGQVDFESSITVKDKETTNETTLMRVIRVVINKAVQKDGQGVNRLEQDGLADKTRIAYKKVFIPIYFMDEESETKEKNSFNNLGRKIQSRLKQCGFVSTVISPGIGAVLIRITDKI